MARLVPAEGRRGVTQPAQSATARIHPYGGNPPAIDRSADGCLADASRPRGLAKAVSHLPLSPGYEARHVMSSVSVPVTVTRYAGRRQRGALLGFAITAPCRKGAAAAVLPLPVAWKNPTLAAGKLSQGSGIWPMKNISPNCARE
jgi:hypothetical protein